MKDQQPHGSLVITRRELVKTVGLGAGALALGQFSPLPAWAAREIGLGLPSPARPIYDLAAVYAEKKFLKPAGVTLKSRLYRGFVPSFAALAKGEVHFSYQTIPPLNRAVKQGFKVKGFLDFAQQFIFVMISRPDISSLDDLVARIKRGMRSGKRIRIASHSPVSQTNIAINRILRVNGLDWKKDVEIVYLTGTPKRLAALKANTVDATVIFLAPAIGNEMQGHVRILAKTADYAPKQSVVQWVASEETLDKRADDVALFTESMIKGYRGMYSASLDELTELAISQKAWSRIKPVKAVREAIKSAREIELWDQNGGATREKVASAHKFLLESGFVKPEEVLPYEQICTSRPVEQALAKLGRV